MIDWKVPAAQPVTSTFLAILVILMFTLVQKASAATITAASCSQASVAAAVASAVDGDVVAVPAGSCGWLTPVLISNKSISIIGAGIGATVINTTGGGGAISWQTKAAGNNPVGFSRLSGFTFTGSGCLPGKIRALVDIYGLTHNLRVDHVRVENTGCYGLQTRGDVRGVLDHNQFVNVNQPGGHVLHAVHDQWNGVTGNVTSGLPCCGDSSWASDSTMGTIDAIVVEDSEFINACSDPTNCWYHTDDLGGGSRVAVRFSRFTNAILAVHGTESGGRQRGFRHWEVYRNRFDWSATAGWPGVFGLRGGTGKLFDNAAIPSGGGSLSRLFVGSTYRRDGPVKEPYPYGRCGTFSLVSITRSGTLATATHAAPADPFWTPWTSSGGSYLEILGVTNEPGWNGVKRVVRTSDTTFQFTVPNSGAASAIGTLSAQSPFDGNTDATGYPCMDQLGRGKGIMITGTEPNGLNGDYAPTNPNPPQWAGNALEPVYSWNNLNNGALDHFADGNPLDVTQENRDFFNQNNSYNGTTQRGIGRGPRSARPATCTANDAWWATDQGNWNTSTTESYSALTGQAAGADGVLDLCTAAGTWQNSAYTPLVYPHPLAGGASPPPPPPARPKNFRAP